MGRFPCFRTSAALLLMAATLAATAARSHGGTSPVRLEGGRGDSGGGPAFVISGNDAVAEEYVNEAIGRAGCAGADSACLKAVCDSVAYLYWSLGYIDVNVTCTQIDTLGAALIEISEGELSSVEAVEIVGASASGRALIEPIFDEAVGEPFTDERFESEIAAALRAYDGAGYPVASITPAVAAVGETGLKLVLLVEEGPRATIGAIVFQGVTKTKHGVLERETGLKMGETYDGSRVEEARQNLMSLGVFETVSEARLALNPRDSSLTVTFEAVEARTSFAEGAVAYGPTPEGSEVYGQVEVSLTNIAGTLRKAGVYWMRRGDARTAWAVSYREPRIFTLPVGLEGSIDSDIDESAYERRRFSLRLVQQDGRRLELSAGWFLATTREGPLLWDGPEEGTRDSYRENGLDIGLMYDRTDRVINPTRGFRGDLRLEFSSFKCDGCDAPDRTIWAGLVGGSYISGIAGNTVAYVGGRYEGVTADKGGVPPSRRIRIGGVNSLRGYPEEWFVTEGAFLGTAELRYIAGPRSRVYLFIDAAVLEGSWLESEGVEFPLLGYGLGLTTGSRIGVFRVEVAAARGEPLGDAKLHLVLTQRF